MATDLFLLAILTMTSSILGARCYQSFVGYQQLLAEAYTFQVAHLTVLPHLEHDWLLVRCLLQGAFCLLGLIGIACILTNLA